MTIVATIRVGLFFEFYEVSFQEFFDGLKKIAIITQVQTKKLKRPILRIQSGLFLGHLQ